MSGEPFSFLAEQRQEKLIEFGMKQGEICEKSHAGLPTSTIFRRSLNVSKRYKRLQIWPDLPGDDTQFENRRVMDAESTVCRGFLDYAGAIRLHASELITISRLLLSAGRFRGQ